MGCGQSTEGIIAPKNYATAPEPAEKHVQITPDGIFLNDFIVYMLIRAC